MSERVASFKARLTGGDALIGTFLKTPSPVVAEVLGLSTLDAVAIDSEHAPFGRVEADGCIAALRAADMPSLVRTADDSPREIRNALDSGAGGIIVPHVLTGAQAEAIVKATKSCIDVEVESVEAIYPAGQDEHQRPQNLELSTRKILATFGIKQLPWRRGVLDALKLCFESPPESSGAGGAL